jgi:poly-gamma-glutamate synthesis protein (capsule biosynthesis protein)
MAQDFTIAVAGDTIINRRISVHKDEKFLQIIQKVRDADIGFTNLESVIHDYDGPEQYPCAEPGWTWMRSPRYTPDELKWAGFDMVSHAANHALDYSYGGLYSTWKALDDAGLPFAGTGKNLGDARAPAYLETSKGRVALISMTSSYSGWARAGAVRQDMHGRPGVNPLRFYYSCDAASLAQITDTFRKLGFTLRNQGKMLLANPPGLNLSLTRFEEGKEPGVSTIVDEDDAAGNIAAIKDARRQADWVIVQLHSHWTHFDEKGGYYVSARFVPPFARECIDAGADVFIEQGGGVLLKGIEIYNGKPIVYDPGGFIRMSSTVSKLPADFFQRWGYGPEIKSEKATPADGYDAREALPRPIQHPGGGRVAGAVLDILTFNSDRKLTGLTIHPVEHFEEPRSMNGIPKLGNTEKGKKMLEYLAKVSQPFGTRIDIKDYVGTVKL